MSFKKIIEILVVYILCQVALCKSVQILTKTLHNVAPTEPSQKASDFIEGPCFGSLHCVHGRCRRRTGETGEFLISECLCEPNWIGLVCDQRRIASWTSGDRTEPSHDVADEKVATKSLFQTIKDYGGQTDVQSRHMVDNVHQYTSESPRGVFGRRIETSEDHTTNICGTSYKPRSIEERTCTPGLLCRFGTCSVDHQGSYIAYNCRCDKGAIGIFCEHKCCLDCGEHGSCQLFENGTQFCNCMRGHSGERCQHGQTAEHTRNSNSSLHHYHWAVIVGVLIAASFVFLTVITTYFIWKRWLGDTNYLHDVTVWYHNNETDDNFVKHGLLPVLEWSALTFSLCVQTDTVSQQEETDESIQRIMDKSFKHIVIYTSKFVQNCPKTGDIILRKHNRVLRDRLVCLYEKETFKTFDHIRNRLARLICRNVYMLCPDKHDEDEVKNFKEKLRTILPTRTILKKLDNA